MKTVRYILLLLYCTIAATAGAQITNGTTTEFYDTASAKKLEHANYFKLLNVKIDGVIITSYIDLPTDKKAAAHLMDSLTRVKWFDAMKNVTDTIILAVDKRFALVDRGNFQYRVKMDGKILADWKQMDFSESKRVYGNSYTLLKGLSRNHKYVIDIKTEDGKDFGQVVSFNYPVPAICGVFFPEQRDQLYQITKYGTLDSLDYEKLPRVPWDKYGNKGGYDTIGKLSSFIRDVLISQDSIKRKFDSIGNNPYVIPSQLDIPDEYNDLLFLMTPIADTLSYEYCLVNDKDTKDTVLKWKKNPTGNAIIEMKGLDGGQYRLYVRYDSPNSHAQLYYFTLRTHNLWSFLRGFIFGVLIVLLPAFIYKYVKKQKRKSKEMQHKMTELQLQSYRAQLNPHFIFNALNSIQSLVNRDDKEQANKYLIDFSTLLRATLDRQSELWTLHDETDLLQKYIRLEQLRFRFHFEMEIDKSIAAENISFPSMLLQPVVENAIKHGISARHEEGRLNIHIEVKADDLVITITDNGKGFDPQDIKGDSKGIALTKERIALLNEQNKERTIKLDINSNSQGTTVTFYLYHYLHNG